jgi:hypothetical protein
MAVSVSPQLYKDAWIRVLPYLNGNEQLTRALPVCKTAVAAFMASRATNQIEATLAPDKINALAAKLSQLPNLTGVTIVGVSGTVYPGPFAALSSIRRLRMEGYVPSDLPSILLNGMERVESLVMRAVPPLDRFGLSLRKPLSHLQHLEVNNQIDYREMLPLLRSSTHYRFLELPQGYIDNDHLVEIAKQDQLETLKFVGPRKNNRSVPLNCGVLIDANKQLREFKPPSEMTPEQLIAFLRQHPNIKHLDVFEVDDRVLEAMATLKQLESVRSHSGMSVTDRGLAILVQGCPRLRELEFRCRSRITAQGLSILEPIGSRLEVLGSFELTIDAATFRLLGTFTGLKVLSLEFSKGSASALLEMLKNLPRLEKLDLNYYEFSADDSMTGDRFLEGLAQGCNSLTSLGMSWIGSLIFTQEGIRNFLLSLPKLTQFYCIGLQGVDAGELESWAKVHKPNLQFTYEAGR